MGGFTMALHILVFLASLAFLFVVIVLIGPALAGVITDIVNVVNPVLISVAGIGNTVSQQVRSSLQTAEAFLVTISDELSSLIQTGLQAGFSAIASFSNTISSALLDAIGAISHAVTFVTQPITSFFDEYIAPVVNYIVQAINLLGTFLTEAVSGLNYVLCAINKLPQFI